MCAMSASDIVRAGDSTDAEASRREAWALFWRIFMADKTRRWQTLSALGLTPMQGQALMTLAPGAPIPMSAVAERMQCDNSNVTGIADRLEALGLIERLPLPHDRRVRALNLTARGVELREQVAQEVGRPPSGFDALDGDEAATLRGLLAKAVDAQPGA
ncbi:MAG: hypothetical protein AVDCRST_MAG38-1874 [uncultured Solirubrobacteraceae bacterium]|uniref:HTH marR-type domain-containing protein n=1 Tax=uncultured Solirubrobacteraceae bacterium TaxID=1162706 RepID=A0A6J4RVB7_9ACTN|nr:MAG: hypothetical protein AVDCRST_MAG38-1874 [uncultured Solirubrobacteraceae bacterium]